ncbi:MAG: SAM-dependent methyltransferase [Verrucomicrobiales bacterium]
MSGLGPIHEAFAEWSGGRNELTFKDFMRLSLYDHQAGYYGAGTASLGRNGDFFTSVSVGGLFGQLLACQAFEVWQKLGHPPVFQVIEQGGHDARLACDVLQSIDEHFPDLSSCINYTVCDPYPVRLPEQDPRLRFCDSLPAAAAENAAALFICNELLDAFPVHRIRFRSDGWKELWVKWEDSAWQINERVPSKELTQAIGARIPSGAYPDGYTTELCTEIDAWMKSAAATLDMGLLLIVDYGFFSDDYYTPERTAGTLRCFSDHQADDDPLLAPGDRDITAHVDWTAVRDAGDAAGLGWIGFSDQGAYLTRLAAPLLQQAERGEKAGIGRKWIRQFQTLTHPGMMGRSFGVMAFAKGIDTTGWTGFSDIQMNLNKSL